MAMCFLKTGLSQEAEETGQTKSVFSRRTERWTGGGLRSCWRTCPLTPREGAKVLRGHAEGHAGGRLFVKERGRWRKVAAGLRAVRVCEPRGGGPCEGGPRAARQHPRSAHARPARSGFSQALGYRAPVSPPSRHETRPREARTFVADEG